MSDENRLGFETLVNFDATTLTANFQAINGTGTTDAFIAFKFYNSGTSLIIFSYNGVDDHDFVPPGGTFIFDVQTNSDGWGNGSGGHKSLPIGTIVSAKTSSNTDRLLMVGYR